MTDDFSYYKALINVKAFLPNDKEIINIIKLCSLINDNKNWKIWYDGFGNKVILDKNKIILKKEDNNQLIKDIHYKLHPINIIKKSKLLLIHKFLNEYYCLFYLSNSLKLSHYKDGWLQNKPPLDMGINKIRLLIQNANIIDYKKFDDDMFLIKLPSSEDFKNTNIEKITNILGLNNAV